MNSINKKMLDKPVTYSGLVDFYYKTIRSDLNVMIKEEIGTARREMNDHFDFLFKKYEDFQQELTVINYQLNRIDQRLDSLETRVTKIEVGVTNIENKVSHIEKRIHSMEDQLSRHEKEFFEIKAQLAVLEEQGNTIKEALERKKASKGEAGFENQKYEKDLAQLKEEIRCLQKRLDGFEEGLSR